MPVSGNYAVMIFQQRFGPANLNMIYHFVTKFASIGLGQCNMDLPD